MTQRLWLTKQENGRFMITMLEPIIQRVRGTKRMDVYPQPGDPMSLEGRHLCDMVLKFYNANNIETLVPILLDVQIKISEVVKPQKTQ